LLKTLKRRTRINGGQQEIEGLFTELAGTNLSQRLVSGSRTLARRRAQLAPILGSRRLRRNNRRLHSIGSRGLGDDGVLYIRDMVHWKWEWPDAKKVIMQTMLAEPNVQHGIEEALHGLAATQELRREPSIANITLRGIRVDKDKISRALPWAARGEAGKVKLIRGPWVGDFLDEISSFPHAHDDMIDSVSGGLQMITKPNRRILYA
jgi:predicted phage terminase large subunit-like protein